VSAGMMGIKSVMSGGSEEESDSLHRQDFDSFEEQGQKSETKTKELTSSADLVLPRKSVDPN